MIAKLQHFLTMIVGRLPYPPVLTGLVVLSFVSMPLAALSKGFTTLAISGWWRFWTLVGLAVVHLLLVLVTPIRRLPAWLQLILLTIQAALTATAQVVLPTPIIDYVYLTIILQAIYLLRAWFWIPFAVGVWAIWSSVAIVRHDLLVWLENNLIVAFPATCVVIAAILYARQQRRHEQISRLIQMLQHQADTLREPIQELQQRAALEERLRLAQTISDEVRTALASAEQSMAGAIDEARSNLARLQVTVTQARRAAGAAIERLRAAVATLRTETSQNIAEPAPPPLEPPVPASDTALASSIGPRVLAWILPFLFIAVTLPMVLLQQGDLGLLLPTTLLGGLLVAAFLLTQRARHPLVLQAGLIGQAAAVLTMTALTQTLAVLLGLLLVTWQMTLRLSAGQIVLFLGGLLATIGFLAFAPLVGWAEDTSNLIVVGIACIVLAGMLGMARTQFSQRLNDELRLVQLARLAHELEQQAQESRTLAITAERARLAREFHDDLGSQLVLINLQLQMAEELIDEDPDAALAQLHATRARLHIAWQSVFAAADAALPIDGPSLTAALYDLIAQSRSSSSALISLHLTTDLEHLPPAIASTIYRTVQEGLANAHKYAQAGEIAVVIASEGGRLNISICDDGQGAKSVPGSQSGGFGLQGLRERAELLGGSFSAGPLPGGGFAIYLSLPDEGR